MKYIVLPLCAALAILAGPVLTATAHDCVQVSGTVNQTVGAPCTDDTQHDCTRVPVPGTNESVFVCLANNTHTKTAR